MNLNLLTTAPNYEQVFNFDDDSFPENIKCTRFSKLNPDQLKETDYFLSTLYSIISEETSDAGRIVRKEILMLQPSTIDEVSQIVVYAQKNKIPFTCGGEGFSVYEQGLIKQGIIIDLSNLNHINQPEADRITIGCGAIWKDIFEASSVHNLTLPVLPDYLNLFSIGYILSIGGIGGQTHRHGTVADNALELKVMTTDGKIHRCSKLENPDLFNASLSTLGQFTIILEATIKLIPPPKKLETYRWAYKDLKVFVSLIEYYALFEIFNHLKGYIIKSGSNSNIDKQFSSTSKAEWYFIIEASLDESYDMKNLTSPYIEELKSSRINFTAKIPPTIKIRKPLGIEHNPNLRCLNHFMHQDQEHPWFNLLPSDQVLNTVNKMMESISMEDFSDDLTRISIELYPINKSSLTCEYFQAPESEMVWALAIHQENSFKESIVKLIEKKRLLYNHIKNNGGKKYPLEAWLVDRNDWKIHYGKQWKAFKQLKMDADPYYLLGRGQGVFKPPK